ncbi:response regulator [Pontibacter sp. H249]|uniref:response regulator n=1 Tax=Pontibacter sp. H249 TaxID=3133420 RepID=UPI0030BDD320
MRIFLIDDDRLSIFLTESMLALEGLTHKTKSYYSAEEALEALSSGGDDTIPNLIFLDLNMPVMDGWAFLDALAYTQLNLKIQKKCRIYILTSSLDLSDTLRTKEYPLVSGLIHKPIKSEDIEFIFSQYSTQHQIPYK